MKIKIFTIYAWLISCVCLTALSFSAAAQPPTATMSSLNGEVFIAFQSGTPILGIAGAVLRSGDIVRTYSGAHAMLSLSDGSKLELGENTNVMLASLGTEPAEARLNLLWGRTRSILSPLYQAEGSSFSLQTPNALIGVKSSEVDVEVLYDPNAKTTTVLAHEFDVRTINLSTGVELTVPKGHSGIIHDNVIQEIAQIIPLVPSDTGEQQSAMLSSISGEVLVSLQGKTVMPGTKGLVLRAGDTVRTNAAASAALQLPDGTTLTLGENSRINLYSLAFDAQSSVRISRIQVLRGALHTLLAEGYQAPGSSFTIQTDNVEVVLDNEPGSDSEVQYVPNTSVSTILANKADLLITHLLTEISMPIPSGHSGIVYNHVIQEVARILPSQIADQAEPEVEAPAEEHDVEGEEKKTTE